MKTHARVVVIGGGVVGAGTLYHLARKGWSDVVLVERRELVPMGRGGHQPEVRGGPTWCWWNAGS